MVESTLSTKVELFLCARSLINKDTFSKSDPFCVIFSAANTAHGYHEVGRTEVIRDNLNPNWKTTVILDYFFEIKQPICFKVFDYDESKPDELGEISTTLGDLVSKGTSFLDLTRKGKLVVRVEEVKTCNDQFQFFMKGVKLDKKDLFGKSDPYLIFYRQLGNTWSEVHRTEIIKNTLDPVWKPVLITAQRLCNGDFKKPIKIDCYDWDRVGSHDLIGSSEVTLEQLSQRGFSFDLYESVKTKQKNKKAGTIVVSDIIQKKILSFIDYLRAGVQISFSLAIDFTASNGEYSSPGSLHNINPNMPNQYEKAIWEIGGILESYDTDRYFPVFGFGGVPRGERSANHCFPLTFNPQNPYVQGVHGIIEAYHNSLRCVSLSGPTLFHHVIDSTIAVTQQSDPTKQYNILMILTDGAIMDMPDTINSIVRASNLPMSIIIVGVGSADFSSMEALDCDDGKLRNTRGEFASRDIVQFVPFLKFSGNPIALAAEVLKEVPNQLTQFMGFINYSPEIPVPRPFSIPVEVEPVNPNVIVPSKEHHHSHHHSKHNNEDPNPLPPLDLPCLPDDNPVSAYEYVVIEEVKPQEYEYVPVNENTDYSYVPSEASVPEYKEDE